MKIAIVGFGKMGHMILNLPTLASEIKKAI